MNTRELYKQAWRNRRTLSGRGRVIGPYTGNKRKEHHSQALLDITKQIYWQESESIPPAIRAAAEASYSARLFYAEKRPGQVKQRADLYDFLRSVGQKK